MAKYHRVQFLVSYVGFVTYWQLFEIRCESWDFLKGVVFSLSIQWTSCFFCWQKKIRGKSCWNGSSHASLSRLPHMHVLLSFLKWQTTCDVGELVMQVWASAKCCLFLLNDFFFQWPHPLLVSKVSSSCAHIVFVGNGNKSLRKSVVESWQIQPTTDSKRMESPKERSDGKRRNFNSVSPKRIGRTMVGEAMARYCYLHHTECFVGYDFFQRMITSLEWELRAPQKAFLAVWNRTLLQNVGKSQGKCKNSALEKKPFSDFFVHSWPYRAQTGVRVW